MFLFFFYGAKLQLFFELAKFFGNYFQFILIFFSSGGGCLLRSASSSVSPMCTNIKKNLKPPNFQGKKNPPSLKKRTGENNINTNNYEFSSSTLSFVQ